MGREHTLPMVMAALTTVLDPKDCYSFIHALLLLLYLTFHPKGYMTPLCKLLTEQYGAEATPHPYNSCLVQFKVVRWLHL